MLCRSKLPECLSLNTGPCWTFCFIWQNFRRGLPQRKAENCSTLGAFVVGIVVGFLGGLFGKGGSAIATPLLSLIGYPGFIAVASPLPATIPGTLVASGEYWNPAAGLANFLVEHRVGIPATILGSLLTKFTGARPLLIAHRNFGAWVRRFFSVFARRKKIRRIFAASMAENRPSVLAAPACAHCHRSRNRFGTSRQCRRIPARAGLLRLPQAADQEIFCMLAGRVRRAGVARDRRPCLPRTYFVDRHGTRCARLRSVFLSRGARCDSHRNPADSNDCMDLSSLRWEPSSFSIYEC